MSYSITNRPHYASMQRNMRQNDVRNACNLSLFG